MTKLVRKSRLRSTISATIAFAMIMSLVVMPAFAAPWPAQKKAAISAVSTGTTGLNAEPGNVSNPGLNGSVAVSVYATTSPSVIATFTPNNGGRPYNLTATLGHWGVTGNPDIQYFLTGVDPVSGQYTGLQVSGYNWIKAWDIQFATGPVTARNGGPVGLGTITFNLGDGQRYRGTLDTEDNAAPEVNPSTVVAGKTDTYTVDIPTTMQDPYGNGTILGHAGRRRLRQGPVSQGLHAGRVKPGNGPCRRRRRRPVGPDGRDFGD
jgi:hypothetical protein